MLHKQSLTLAYSSIQVVQVWYNISTQFEVLGSLSTPIRRTDSRHAQALSIDVRYIYGGLLCAFCYETICLVKSLSQDAAANIIPDNIDTTDEETESENTLCP